LALGDTPPRGNQLLADGLDPETARVEQPDPPPDVRRTPAACALSHARTPRQNCREPPRYPGDSSSPHNIEKRPTRHITASRLISTIWVGVNCDRIAARSASPIDRWSVAS